MILVEDDEFVAIEPRQTLVGPQPKIAIRCLGNGSNRVLRKSVFLRPDRPGILRETLAGIQGEGEGWSYNTKPDQSD